MSAGPPSAEELLALAARNIRALEDIEHQARAAAWREARDREERWRLQGFAGDEERARRRQGRGA